MHKLYISNYTKRQRPLRETIACLDGTHAVHELVLNKASGSLNVNVYCTGTLYVFQRKSRHPYNTAGTLLNTRSTRKYTNLFYSKKGCLEVFITWKPDSTQNIIRGEERMMPSGDNEFVFAECPVVESVSTKWTYDIPCKALMMSLYSYKYRVSVYV